MADYTQGIKIDGMFFNIPLVSIKRTADVLDKYAKRTEDGDLKREIIGVYFNYQMTIGMINDVDTYEALWNKLTEPVEFHDIELPDLRGTYSFRGYISSVSDEMRKVLDSGVQFDGLTCKFTSKTPSRK